MYTCISLAAGYSERGFVFDETNFVDLEFTIHKESATGTKGSGFPQVEVWLFPDRSLTPTNRVLDIRFLVQANVPPATNPRSYQPRILWNTTEDCVYLNLTRLSKRILKLIRNESTVKLRVEVTRLAESNERIENDHINVARRDLCACLSQRRSNNSFLIIKNYDESSVPFTPPNAVAVSKRDVSEIDHVNVSADAFINSCGVVPLIADLTEVYGDFIKAPTLTDVKDCSGRCTLLLDRPVFTKHGEIKERLKLLPGGEALSNFQPCCMPVRFKPLHVLIRLKDKSEVIVQMPDLVVDKCACQ